MSADHDTEGGGGMQEGEGEGMWEGGSTRAELGGRGEVEKGRLKFVGVSFRACKWCVGVGVCLGVGFLECGV
jgi:hypothetical protein